MPPELRFSDKVAFEKMGKIQRTRKNQLRAAVRDGAAKPGWVKAEDWKIARKEFKKNPAKFTQQVEARWTQLQAGITSRLGSGGLDSFKALFVSTVHFAKICYLQMFYHGSDSSRDF